eukprot:gi/632958067/ref/XP_007894825.1/ PREDICTED: uncharacterized protein KIAA0753 homolog [Callorhinchus milii]
MAANAQHQHPQFESLARDIGTWIPTKTAGQHVGRSEQSGVQLYKTQLQFNKAISGEASNLAMRFSEPSPIIIEKLRKPNESSVHLNAGRSSDDGLQFSAVSEDKLNAAVKMAKRDLRRRQLEEKVKDYVYKRGQTRTEVPKPPGRGKAKPVENVAEGKSQSKGKNFVKPGRRDSKEEFTESGARVYIYTPDFSQTRLAQSDSPLSREEPTRDPGHQLNRPRVSNRNKDIQEIHRLRSELSKYIQKIEELARKEKCVDVLDPDEEHRAQKKRQEQGIRSARMLYVLQQQANEIQEEIEKEHPPGIKHTKKSRAMSRLVAAHRGAIRALQLLVNQQMEQQVPVQCKELGQLIRQLSLCSARLETDLDASLSDSIIDVLQQVEDLDWELGKQQPQNKSYEASQKAQSSSLLNRVKPQGQRRSGSAERSRKLPVTGSPKQLSPARRPLTDDNQNSPESLRQQCSDQTSQSHSRQQQQKDGPPIPERNTNLKAGLEASHRAGTSKKGVAEKSATSVKKGALLANKLQPEGQKAARPLVKNVSFQKTTLSSRLKKTQATSKESRLPWIPPNPTSPPGCPQRALWKKQGAKVRSSSPKPTGGGERTQVEQDRKEAAETEAIRLAWLDSETARRMQELNQLCKQEMDRIQKMRPESRSPSKLVSKAEEEIQGRLQPLLDKVQNLTDSWEKRERVKDGSLQQQLSSQVTNKAIASADLLSENLLDELLEDTAQELWNLEQNAKAQKEAVVMQDSPTLETMLQRMEEMEKYQEEVRRRVCKIEYADPDFWAEEEKRERAFVSIDTKPHTPKPFTITKPFEKSVPEPDIILQRPLEAEAEDLAWDERPQPARISLRPTPHVSCTWRKQGSNVLSLPESTLQSIRRYQERFDQHLKMISHEPIGKFNPWLITESLAEELLDEGLRDVAVELQDVCEEYAEALFTSEFMQPVE